jgi:ferredoxin--NADP+ reductase
MNEILKKEQLTKDIFKFVVKNSQVAKKAQPGQFVIIRLTEKGERIPLTIADSDELLGTITLISMTVGKTTMLLARMNEGEYITDLLGPLGKKSEIENFGKVVCVGGGVGIAPVFPILKGLKREGNYVIGIIGARSKNMLILEEEMSKNSDEFYVCTDDGSKGFKGFVSSKLEEVILSNISSESNSKINRVIAIGPTLMMATVSHVTKKYDIKTIVSLNSVMIDGTGMCGTCRVEVGGKTKFACVDGPDFDAHLVNFDLLLARQQYYCEEEKISLEKFKEKHQKLR